MRMIDIGLNFAVLIAGFIATFLRLTRFCPDAKTRSATLLITRRRFLSSREVFSRKSPLTISLLADIRESTKRST
jgi:hypothetical protein